MNCNQYQEWVSAEIDGMLDERQTRLLWEHLAECPACRQAKADLERTITLIRELPKMTPPQDLLDSIHQRIAREPKTRRIAWRILALPQTRVALAAALLMIAVIYGSRQEKPSLAMEAAQANRIRTMDGVPAKANLRKGQEVVFGTTQIHEDRQAAAINVVRAKQAAVPAAPRPPALAQTAKPQHFPDNGAQIAQKARARLGGAQAGAAAPAREPSVKLLVVTANPAAVLRMLDPYRQEQQRDQGMAISIAEAAKPAAVAAVALSRKSEGNATGILSESEARGQATFTTAILWVPAGEYSELLKKVKVLGEITDETRPTDKAQRSASDTHSVSDQSAELISVQVHIQMR